MIDLSEEVNSFLNEIQANDGQLLVYSLHTTLAIVVNEKESGITHDLEVALEEVAKQDKYYRHNDMEVRTENLVCSTGAEECLNGHSHLRHLLLGTSEVLPISKRKWVRGRWQWLMAIELDGPKNRELVLQYIGT